LEKGLIEANSEWVMTALNPYIGYENSAIVANEALETGRSVYDLVLEKKLPSKEEIDRILNPSGMIQPRRTEKT
jgi:aspartate ammonia-lyase